jgi:hypothetical protein
MTLLLYRLFLLISVTLISDTKISLASPCYPTDPTGNNPQNPCLQYPLPGISADSFVQGQAKPIREAPSIQNPAGRILAAPSGYWTGSETKDNTREIMTNQGKLLRFKSN